MSTLDDGAVVVCGEALIDLVLAPDGSLDGHPGGGPYNVARTIGRRGQPVAYLGCLEVFHLGTLGLVFEPMATTLEVRAPAVAVVDTIGAGDAFMGAFLARWRARTRSRRPSAPGRALRSPARPSNLARPNVAEWPL
jgi:fructokinase